MNSAKKILFVVNPISGGNSRKTGNILALIKELMPADSNYEIKIWEKPDEGPAIQNLITSGKYDMVAVAGGDGTINLVAQAAVKAGITMAIIPKGSGNGLARHLNIPLDTAKAIRNIYEGREVTIDTGKVNGHLFLCTSGAGFDALIGDLFANSKTRGLVTYAKISLQQLLAYKPREYTINFDGKMLKTKAFIIAFANVNQYGNNTYIAPQANVEDGYLDICIIKPYKFYQLPGLAIRIFNKTLTGSKLYEYHKAKKIQLKLARAEAVHYDGEPVNFGDTLDIEVQPASLKIIAGKEYKA